MTTASHPTPNPLQRLRDRMQAVGISSFKALAIQAQVSEWQLRQIRQGNLQLLRLVSLQRISQALDLTLSDFLALFEVTAPEAQPTPIPETTQETSSAQAAIALRQECLRLQAQLEQQKITLSQQWQRDSLYTLEPWLKNWPKVVHALTTSKPDLPLKNVIKLLDPIQQLLQQWGVEAIGSIDAVIPFDPQIHTLINGSVQPGEAVQIKLPGYRQGETLLYRAEVIPT